MLKPIILVLSITICAMTICSQDLPTQLSPEYAQIIREATPASLPQSPAVKRETTDAQDKGLRGRVKVFVREAQDLSGTWVKQGRYLDLIEEYDETGNLTRRITFNVNGDPFDIEVFGYIDGMRVSREKMLHPAFFNYIEENRPSLKPTGKPDPRFTYEHRYKYDKGALIETQVLLNDGATWHRTTYERAARREVMTSYSFSGKASKTEQVLDERGNVTESTDAYSTKRMSYESFDAHGNWTKQIASKPVVESGKEIYKPAYITYRTFTYYPR